MSTSPTPAAKIAEAVITKYRQRSGFDPRSSFDPIASALHEIAGSNQPNAVKLLTYLLEKYGEDRQVRAGLGIKHALTAAAKYGQLEVVRYLLTKYKEDFYANNIVIAFSGAAQEGRLDIVKYFFEIYSKEVEVARVLDVKRALNVAIQKNQSAIVLYLIKTYSTDLDIVQTVSCKFNSLDESTNFSQLNCLIKAIIDSNKWMLLSIITQSEILRNLKKLYQAQPNDPGLAKTIPLLIQAKITQDELEKPEMPQLRSSFE